MREIPGSIPDITLLRFIDQIGERDIGEKLLSASDVPSTLRSPRQQAVAI